MPDTYLAISQIANSKTMTERLNACVTQEAKAGNVPFVREPLTWVGQNRYLWAASPGWAAAWVYAMASHPEPDFDPGKDEAVITDGMILAAVQDLGSNA